MSRINNKMRKNQKNVRRWVIIHTNMVGYEIDDATMCFMGCKSMGKDCIIMNTALS
jgi:hypothetical protein